MRDKSDLAHICQAVYFCVEIKCCLWLDHFLILGRRQRVFVFISVLLLTIVATIGSINIQLFTDIHALQRVNLTAFGDVTSSATMRLMFVQPSEIPQQLLDGFIFSSSHKKWLTFTFIFLIITYKMLP